jgi:hypothetical protein
MDDAGAAVASAATVAGTVERQGMDESRDEGRNESAGGNVPAPEKTGESPGEEGAARPGGSRARDVEIILGFITLAFCAVAAVVLTHVRETGPAPTEGRPTPDSIVPARPPYADLVHGDFREVEAGLVELRYDFDPLPRVEGRLFSESDLYPQLRDWNTSLAGSKVRTGVVRGEGRLSGEARTRTAFEGPLAVEVELEFVAGAAGSSEERHALRPGTSAVQIATNTGGEGYECLVSSDGEVRLRSREMVASEEEQFDDIATLSEQQKEMRREEVVKDLAPPARIAPPAGRTSEACGPAPAGRRLHVVFARTEDSLSVEIDGARVIGAALPVPDPWPAGNVALRSPSGSALWDDVRITGRFSRAWLEETIDIAIQLTGTDYYEPDDVWPMARELAANAEDQVRTFSPAGDVDWITVAVPEDAEAVTIETLGLELGIDMVASVFEIDGRTPLGHETLQAGEPGAVRIAVPVATPDGGRLAFYVRVSEAEGRCGTYRILARPTTSAGAARGP